MALARALAPRVRRGVGPERALFGWASDLLGGEAKAKAEALAARVAELEAAGRDHTQEVTRLKRDAKDLKGELEAATRRVKELEAAARTARAEATERDGKLTRAEQLSETLRSRLADIHRLSSPATLGTGRLAQHAAAAAPLSSPRVNRERIVAQHAAAAAAAAPAAAVEGDAGGGEKEGVRKAPGWIKRLERLTGATARTFPITLGEGEFHGWEELWSYCSRCLQSTAVDQDVSDADKRVLIALLLRTHPDAAVKLGMAPAGGSGATPLSEEDAVAQSRITMRQLGMEKRCFVLTFPDGREEDFSYRRCISRLPSLGADAVEADGDEDDDDDDAVAVEDADVVPPVSPPKQRPGRGARGPNGAAGQAVSAGPPPRRGKQVDAWAVDAFPIGVALLKQAQEASLK